MSIPSTSTRQQPPPAAPPRQQVHDHHDDEGDDGEGDGGDHRHLSKAERKKVDVIEHQRRRRIAAGAGVQPADVSQFIKQFEMARDAMKAFTGMGAMGKMRTMKALMGGGLAAMGQPGGPMLRTKGSGHMEKKDRNKKKKR